MADAAETSGAHPRANGAAAFVAPAPVAVAAREERKPLLLTWWPVILGAILATLVAGRTLQTVADLERRVTAVEASTQRIEAATARIEARLGR